MSNQNLTHVAVILDRSGSMSSIKSDTVGGFAAFIEKQREQPGATTVSLCQFDDQYEVVYTGAPIEKVPALVLEPRGSTALLDAIGRTIHSTRLQLAATPEPERPGSVMVVIVTDGMENASQEFTYAAVSSLIRTQEQLDGWTFVYLGANQDAIAVASRLGVDQGQALTYTGPKTSAAWAVTADRIGAEKAARAAGLSAAESKRRAAFTDDQRRDAAE